MLTVGRRGRLVAIATAPVLAGALLVAGVESARSADSSDPVAVAVPLLDDGDTAKAVVARVRFDSRTEATVEDVTVSEQRAHSHVGDPPILRLVLKDVDGARLAGLNAWSPLWVFTSAGSSERLEVQDEGSGSFIVPFSQGLSSMVVEDVTLDREVAVVDLEPAIQEFCVAHPADPDCIEADLAVTSAEGAVPLFAVLNRAVTLQTTSVVADLGPDGPVTGTVTQSVTPGPGVSVEPPTTHTGDLSLAVGAPATLTRSYALTCTEPGATYVDVTTSVVAKLPTVVDPDGTNNSATSRVSVDCAVPIAINVQPGSRVNPVNLGGSTLPVAALTTRAGEYGNPLAFDARTIVASTVRFASEAKLLAGLGAPEIHGQIHPSDSLELDEVTRDGDRDALVHVRPRATSLVPGDTRGCMVGRAGSPQVTFFGCDSVRVTK